MKQDSALAKDKKMKIFSYKFEIQRFFVISFFMFFILFNQNVLRILKDSILVSELSAELISFTKLYFVSPIAAILVILYAKLLGNKISLFRMFYYFIAFFTFFFIVFAFFLYPNVKYVHMNQETIAALSTKYHYMKWYIILIGNWSYVFFYSFCELWPNIFYVLFFWQFMNNINTTEQAKKFYTLFAFVGNSSLIIVGILMEYLSSFDNLIYRIFFPDHVKKILMTQISLSLVGISSLMCCFLLHKIKSYSPHKNFVKEESELKMGFIASAKYILRSKYLWFMFVCASAFSITMDLVEGVWKSKMKELYPNINDYANFNSNFIFWTGICIMLFTLLGNLLIRKYNWFISAILTPTVIMVTGLIFFALVICENGISQKIGYMFSFPVLDLIVVIGALQNILSKGIKYSIWDSAMQMLYIPLDEELKTKGKAAVDVASPKIGKSLSSLVQTILFTFIIHSTYSSIAPILLVIFIVVALSWIFSVSKIHTIYKEKVL